jgi:hypothetical protein
MDNNHKACSKKLSAQKQGIDTSECLLAVIECQTFSSLPQALAPLLFYSIGMTHTLHTGNMEDCDHPVLLAPVGTDSTFLLQHTSVAMHPQSRIPISLSVSSKSTCGLVGAPSGGRLLDLPATSHQQFLTCPCTLDSGAAGTIAGYTAFFTLYRVKPLMVAGFILGVRRKRLCSTSSAINVPYTNALLPDILPVEICDAAG